MAFQSPYRGEERFSPRTRELISRGTMLLLGLVMLHFAWRGGMRLHELNVAAATQPALPPVGRIGNRRDIPVASLPYIVITLLAIAGGVLAISALLPLRAIQSTFETLYTPPATSDRSGDLPRHSIWRLLRWIRW